MVCYQLLTPKLMSNEQIYIQVVGLHYSIILKWCTVNFVVDSLRLPANCHIRDLLISCVVPCLIYKVQFLTRNNDPIHLLTKSIKITVKNHFFIALPGKWSLNKLNPIEEIVILVKKGDSFEPILREIPRQQPIVEKPTSRCH